MSHGRRIVLIAQDGEEGPFSLPNIRAYREGDEPHCVALSLPHPRLGLEAPPMRYLETQTGDLLELNSATKPIGTLYSWAIGDFVCSDGSLLIATRIDPGFFLLPALVKYGRNWAPLDQVLAEAGILVLKRLKNVPCDELCDKNGKYGGVFCVDESVCLPPQYVLTITFDHHCPLAEMALEDMVLYRLNDTKALTWLSQKVERLKRCLQKFNTRFELDTPPCHDLYGKKDERQILLTALELVCDYLPGEWGAKLASKYDCDVETLFSGERHKNKRPASVWEAQNKESDRLLELSRGEVGKDVVAEKLVSRTLASTSSKLLKAKASAK